MTFQALILRKSEGILKSFNFIYLELQGGHNSFLWRKMESVNQVQILDNFVCISLYTKCPSERYISVSSSLTIPTTIEWIELSSLGGTASLKGRKKFQIQNVEECSLENLILWSTILLLSPHPKSENGSTQAFTNKQIICVVICKTWLDLLININTQGQILSLLILFLWII